MPRNPTTQPFGNLSAEQKLAAVFNFEPLYHVDPAVLAPTVPSGRRYTYPPLLQFLVSMTARVFGSQNSALAELRKPGVWEQCCTWYAGMIGEALTLPAAPPTPREQDSFVTRVTQERHLLQRLSTEITEVSIGQAFQQGQFPHGTTLDMANPDRRHLVFGDGTWQASASKVRPMLDEHGNVTGYSGSRATRGQARVQDVGRWGRFDDKDVDGVNNLFLGTWTDDGRIILACAATIESEGKIAARMVDQLATRLGRRLQAVVYDRALSGWWLQDLMARHGVLILTKPIARSSQVKHSDGHTAALISEHEAIALYQSPGHLPVGTTVYSGPDGLNIVRSTYHRLTETPRPIAGCAHRHDLWVDGGVLVDVQPDPDSGRLVKRAAATSLEAQPQPAPSLLTWELPIEWRLPCPVAPEAAHTFTTVWRPQPGRTERPARGSQRALHDLRPIGIHDSRFWHLLGVRNNAESHNSSYKDTFRHDGRAMRYDVAGQYLDQLSYAAVVNAITWWTFNRRADLNRQHHDGRGATLTN